MSAIVHASELDAATRRAVEARTGRKVRPRRATMSKDDVRGHAIRVLAVIAELSQRDRRRVLEHAARVNAV